jgi:hypothetical protein
MTGALGKPLKVRVEHRGHRVHATLVRSSSEWSLNIVNRNNDPAVLTAFRSAGPPMQGSDVNVEFVGDRFAELGAKLSWLRSGFLALFAAFGYGFSFNPALQIVKRQLRAPDTSLIYCFTIVSPEQSHRPCSQWRIVEISEPRCTGVLFGRYVVVFPQAGDVRFYERLETDIRSRERKTPVTITAQSFELFGGEPLFGYELPDLKTG